MLRSLTVSALSAVVLFGAGQALAAQPTRTGGLQLSLPAVVEPDSLAAVEFRLPAQVAAVDGRLYLDMASADVVGVAPVGTGVAMAPLEISGGVAFGAYGLAASNGRTIMRVILAPHVAGRLQLRVVIDAAADAMGHRLTLGRARALASLSVGRASVALNAPRDGARQLVSRAAGQAHDLIADGTIDSLDLDVARAGWERAQGNDAACVGLDPAADANGDGCVDIVDLQALLAAPGRSTSLPAGTRSVDVIDRATPMLAALAGTGLVFVVTSTADTADATNGDGLCADSEGRCTLRAAITESNWQEGDNRIEFNLPGTAPVLIQLGSSPMSLIQDRTGGLVIDGYSQPGSRVNTATVGSDAIPGVELRGTGSSPRGNAFRITSANNSIRGFLLTRHYRPVFMDGPDAHHNQILGNLIGFTRSGAVDGYRGSHAVRLNVGAHDNVIGSSALADRNVIGNFTHAVDLYGPGTDSNVVQNNVLCMTPSGTGQASCSTAIDHNFGPKDNLHGGYAAGERNVIGRTTLNGIEISHGWDPGQADTSTKWQNNNNRVIGNWIGFRGDGSYDAAFRSGQKSPNNNDANGVNVYDGSNFNLVEGNWIGSVWDGVNVMSSNSTGNVIRNNTIGESPLGQAAPLNRYGINVRQRTTAHLIEGNVIRNAGVYGIGLTQKDVLWVRISRNIITDMAGPAIYLAPDPSDPSKGANNLLPPPVITSATSNWAGGAGISGATVEVYRASRPAGQSGLPEEYLGSAVVASNGSWAMPITVAAGQVVTALQINPANNTSALGVNVTVQPTGTATTYAADAFGRTSSGWGSADVGGSYSLQGNAVNYGLANGLGTMLLPAKGASRAALLNGVTPRDVEILLRVGVNKVAAGGRYYVYAVARRNGNSEYRPRLLFNADGSVSVNASVLTNGSESSLGAAVAVAGLSQSADGFIWLRAQVTGASPTTIRVKAWADGEAEPAGWQFSATNSHAAVQVAGAVGLRAYISRSVSTAPVVVSFDDYSVISTT